MLGLSQRDPQGVLFVGAHSWARDLALELQGAGFKYIRQQFPWEDIEIHGKGDFTDRRNEPAGIDAWAKYDNIVDLAEQHDVEIIARLDNPPAWTRAMTDTIGTHAPPDNFVAVCIMRFARPTRASARAARSRRSYRRMPL